MSPARGGRGSPLRVGGGAAKTRSWARCSERLGRRPAAHRQGLWLRASERECEGGLRPGKAGASRGGVVVGVRPCKPGAGGLDVAGTLDGSPGCAGGAGAGVRKARRALGLTGWREDAVGSLWRRGTRQTPPQAGFSRRLTQDHTGAGSSPETPGSQIPRCAASRRPGGSEVPEPGLPQAAQSF